jgi:hypothetical protein
MESLIYLLKSIAEIFTHTRVIFLAIVACIVGFYECENSVAVQYSPSPNPHPNLIIEDLDNKWIPPKPKPNPIIEELIPPKPEPNPTIEDINISGIWNDETGGFSQFTQNGSAISYVNYNLLGQKVGYGDGEIFGNTVELVGIENSSGFNNVELNVKLNLSKNGQRLSGTISSSILGLSFPLNLTKR